MIKSVEVCLKPSVEDLEYKPALIFKDYTNFEAQIINADENLAYKISAYLEALSKLTPNDRENAYLYVYQENSKIIVHLIKK